MLLPALQKQFSFFHEEPLHGDVRLAADTVLRADNWFEGRFAGTKEKYINDNFGFRNWFVRLRNQVYFSAFDQAFAKEVVLGKSNYLYESRYLDAYSGKDYIGDKPTEDRFEKLKFIQDSLAKRGVTLVLLFAPGKATYLPEYIPDSYGPHAEKTNYLSHIHAAKIFGINHIDLNGWFLQMKATTKFPLYPQTGTHWSTYASYIAFDSINKYLEQKLGKKLPRFTIDKVEWKEELAWNDKDIEDALNLFDDMPHYKLPYPSIIWPDTQNCFRPRVLTISDSYWGGFYEHKLTKATYTNPEFWSYDQLVLDYSPALKKKLSFELDLKTHVEQKDVVFIMASEASLRFMGWDFIEEVYRMYKDGPARYSELQASRRKSIELTMIKTFIASDELWFNGVKRDAEADKISVDSSLQQHAESVYKERHKSEHKAKK
jgi:hypothetical protein